MFKLHWVVCSLGINLQSKIILDWLRCCIFPSHASCTSFAACPSPHHVLLATCPISLVPEARGVTYLRVVDERAHIADDARGALFGVARAIAQTAVNDGNKQREAGGVDGVDERRAKHLVQCATAVLVGLGDRRQQARTELLNLRVPDDRADLHTAWILT